MKERRSEKDGAGMREGPAGPRLRRARLLEGLHLAQPGDPRAGHHCRKGAEGGWMMRREREKRKEKAEERGRREEKRNVVRGVCGHQCDDQHGDQWPVAGGISGGMAGGRRAACWVPAGGVSVCLFLFDSPSCGPYTHSIYIYISLLPLPLRSFAFAHSFSFS